MESIETNTLPATKYGELTADAARRRALLSADALNEMHLRPTCDAVAYMLDGERTVLLYDPEQIEPAEPGTWYVAATAATAEKKSDRVDLSAEKTVTLPDGREMPSIGVRRAAGMGLYTKSRLERMGYDVTGEPIACQIHRDGVIIWFYEKTAAKKRPPMCVVCGKFPRYRSRMCRDCFEADLAVKRAAGDAYRAAPRNMDRKKVLFFDLELTGVYVHDEIISVSICDAEGTLLMDTLVRPLRKKKWTRTEKIHGITPDMVRDAPTLDELIPDIKRMFDGCDELIAYGVSTDYSHIKYIYETEEEQEILRKKTRCAAAEYVRWQREHRPDLTHTALVDAMAALGITWDGIPHSSVADTVGCMKVWEAMFPNYYATPAPEAVTRGMTGQAYDLVGKDKLERAAYMQELARQSAATEPAVVSAAAAD